MFSNTHNKQNTFNALRFLYGFLLKVFFHTAGWVRNRRCSYHYYRFLFNHLHLRVNYMTSVFITIAVRQIKPNM